MRMRLGILLVLLTMPTVAWAQATSYPIIGQWFPNTVYLLNELARYGGTVYICVLSPCQANFDPQTHGESWNAMSGLRQWDATTRYEPGNMVMQNGTLFTAKIANTNSDPGGANNPYWNPQLGEELRGRPAGALYNVRDFGATGLGCPTSGTEDTLAFQRAIAAASAVSPTAAAPDNTRGVYVPAGNYCITSKLTIAKNFFAFFGDGSASILTSTTASPILQLDPDGGGGPFGMSVHDLLFRGAAGTTGITVNPVAANSGRSQYYNLTFDAFGTAISFLDKSDWNTFTGISIISGTNGMNFTGIGTGNIFSSLMILSSGIGIDLHRSGADTGIGDITFSGLQFGGNFTTAMRFQAAPGSYSDRIAVINAQFDASCGTGIDMQGYSNVILSLVIGGCVTNNLTNTTGAISLIGNVNAVLMKNMKTTGASGNKVVCINTTTGELFASSTGTDCS